jgi:hypothetical protein
MILPLQYNSEHVFLADLFHTVLESVLVVAERSVDSYKDITPNPAAMPPTATTIIIQSILFSIIFGLLYVDQQC